MVLAEYSREAGVGVPGSVHRGDGDGMIIFNVPFAY